MSINVPSNFGIQYATVVDLLLQQKGSRLRNLVDSMTHTGKQASPVDQIGSVEVQTPAGRFAPMGRVDAPMDRRWVFPVDKDLPQLLDKRDMLRLLNSGQYLAKYQENASNSFGRWVDTLIVASAFADAKTGETGSGTEQFDTTNFSIANDYGAAAATGLTVDKLLEVRRMFEDKFIDLEVDEPTIVIGTKQKRDLMGQQEIVSRDYNDTPVLVNGVLKKFLGFNIVESTLLTTSSTDRYNIAFVKSGIHLGIWEDISTEVDQRVDLSGKPWQVYSHATMGATRTQQGKVVRVIASEA